jgi:hypothetical protein
MPWEQPTPREWNCGLCGFASPWWIGCERFPLCVACDARKRQSDRATLREDARQERADIPAGYVLLGRPDRLRETEKAILLAFRGAAHWVPKSAIAEHPCGVIVRDWMFRKIAGQQAAA